MTFTLLFMAALAAAVLLSSIVHRSVLSTAVLFLAVGAAAGAAGLLHVEPTAPVVTVLLEVTLFAVLFTDGTTVTIAKLRRAWRLPGRALLLGMPLTVIIGALIARALTDLSWLEAFTVSAVLSPTDPVFAAAIIGAAAVPKRLRHLLHVESGVNDGLALPLVVVLIAVASGKDAPLSEIGLELALGLLVGVAVPAAMLALESLPALRSHGVYQPLNAVAIAGLTWGTCHLVHANPFLAAFAAGVVTGSMSKPAAQAYHAFGEGIAELLKLAALLAFGAMLTPALMGSLDLGEWVAVILLIVLARPAALAVALWRSELTGKERAAAGWFGPKGFASVAYGLLVLTADTAHSASAFNLIAICVAVSIVAHSSTDVVVARLFTPLDECDEAAGGATGAEQEDLEELCAWDAPEHPGVSASDAWAAPHRPDWEQPELASARWSAPD